jgi:hypothetical protein
MFERRGNRFHPQTALPSKGRLGSLIASTWRSVRKAGRRGPYTREELETTARLVELLSFREDWVKVAEVASRAIVLGCGPRASLRFYRAWLEALRGTQDVEGLQALARHLLLRRAESDDYLALACMALAHAGRRAYGKVLYARLAAKAPRHPRNQNPVKEASATRADPIARTGRKTERRNSALAWEAIAVWLCEAPKPEERLKGVDLLARLCAARKQRYFTLRNYLSYSLEADELEHASAAYNAMHDRFPFAPDPYLAAARISMSENDYAAASVALQELLADNPRHPDAILALASCLERTGDLLAARDILASGADLFDADDYDFNATSGVINKKLHERYGMAAHRASAIRQLSMALRAAGRMGLPQASLHTALFELEAGVGEQALRSSSVKESETVWMLTVEDDLADKLVSAGEVILRAPGDATVGRTILLTRPNPRVDGVEMITAVLETTSPVVPDTRYGRAIAARVVKTLSVPLEVELHDVRYPLRDAWGCENFAEGKFARFYELPMDEAMALLAQLAQTPAAA